MRILAGLAKCVLGVGMAFVAGCNLSSVDKQAASASVPTAVIAAIAQPYSTDASGAMNTTVRSGADVELTGKNSYKSNNDTGVPIVQFQWKRTDAGTDSVLLISRTSNSVAFTAPQVQGPSAETIQIQLTVTDANGNSAIANANVTVLPVRDADHFLKYLATSDGFVVTAATSAAIMPSSAAANVTIPYTVTVTKLLQFTDDSPNPITSTVQIGTPVTYSGGWSAALGSGGTDCSSVLNPKLTVPVPRVNFDDVINDAGSPHNGQPLSNVMQAANIDSATASAKIEIAFAAVGSASTVAAPAGVNAYLCAAVTGTASAASITETSEQLLSAAANAATALRDNNITAAAYYQTLDPGNQAKTLSAWLQVNGFNATAGDYGASAKPASIFHALYTNNYDLGLGRDMYMSVGPCDAGYDAKPLAQKMGHCDVASVVVNYVSVEAAIKKLNPVVAVAMEYTGPATATGRAPPGTGPRFTKFYTFAPDTSSGDFRRVLSVDLDHRGQKNLPQACLICHGGVPAGVSNVVNGVYPSTYPATPGTTVNGDVNAGFLPWDLDSFWYSDTDPGFSSKSEDAAIKAQYTQMNQAAQFKSLNSGAYLTLAHATASGSDPNRYAVLQELLEGWYSGAGLPGSFNGSWVPPGWSEGGAYGNPTTTSTATGSKTVYLDVFARSCRSCHVMQAPAAGVNPTDVSRCQANSPNAGLGLGADQFPMGCYWQFLHTKNLAAMVSEGAMPLARRTTDRLWADPAGGATKGKELLDHLNAYYQQAGVPQDTQHAPARPFVAVAPGTANVYLAPFGATVPSGCASPPPNAACVDILSWVPLTLYDNGYAAPAVGDLIEQPSWQVCKKGSAANCAGAAAFVPVVAAGRNAAVFQIPKAPASAASPYSFIAELDSASTAIADQQLDVILSAPIPTSAGLPTTIKLLGSVSITSAMAKATVSASPGNGPYSLHTWWISNLSSDLQMASTGSQCLVNSPCQLDCPTGVGCPNVVLQQEIFAANPSYRLNVADADGKTGFVSVSMSTQSGIVVNTQTGFVAIYATDSSVSASSTGLIVAQNDQQRLPKSCSTLGNCLDLSDPAVNSLPDPTTQAWQAQVQCGAVWATSCALGSNGQGAQGTVTVVGSSVQYTPPHGFSTTGYGGGASGALQTNYRLLIVDQSSPTTVLFTSASATLNIAVISRVSWTNDVIPVFVNASPPSTNGQCTGCHFAGATFGASLPLIDFNWSNATLSTYTSHDLYCNLVGCGSTGPLPSQTTTTADPFVETINLPSTVLTSVLIAHPGELDTYGGHSGSDRCPTTSPPPANFVLSSATSPQTYAAATPATCDLLPMLYWIEDGASEN